MRRNKAKSADDAGDRQDGELLRAAAFRKSEKELREVTRKLLGLSNEVLAFLTFLDRLMKMPESAERGKRISQLANSLEFTNDQIRYFTLGVDFRNDTKKPVKYRRLVKR